MMTLGIDPGLQGALCWMDERGEVIQLVDIPVLAEGKKKSIDAFAVSELSLIHI